MSFLRAYLAESANMRRGHAWRARRLILFAAIFVVVGPPVGGLVAWTFMGLPTLQSPAPFISGSWGEGAALAAAAGLLLGIGALWFGLSGWPAPVIVAAIVNVAFLATTVLQAPPDLGATLWRVASVFVPTSFAATIACWYLARLLLGIGRTA